MRGKNICKKSLILIFIYSCLTSIGIGQSESSTPFITFHGKLYISTNYNDNILDYSLRDITKFDSVKYNPSNLKKFSVTSLGDDVTDLKLKFGTTLKLIKKNPTSIWLRTSQYFYGTNQIRNYSSWQLELNQAFFKSNHLSLGYYYLPRYYLRNLWYHQKPERNPYRLFSRYVEEFLTKRSYSFNIGRDFDKYISAEIGYDYEYTNYNREFEERNNHTHIIKSRIGVDINKLISMDGGLQHAESWANGRSDPDSTIADISYKSNMVTFGFDVHFLSWLNIPLSLKNNFAYEDQKYLSGKVPVDTLDEFGNKLSYGDKYHYGRRDKYYKISTELAYDISKGMNIYLEYYYARNKTNLAETSDAGSYQTHQVGGGIRLSF